LPNEYTYFRLKASRAALYERKYGRKAKAALVKKGNKKLRVKKKFPLVVVKPLRRVEHRINRRGHVKYSIPKHKLNKIIKYNLLKKNIDLNYSKGTFIKARRKRGKKKKFFLNPFVSKKYNKKLQQKRKLLRLIIRNKAKVLFKKSLRSKTKLKLLYRAK